MLVQFFSSLLLLWGFSFSFPYKICVKKTKGIHFFFFSFCVSHYELLLLPQSIPMHITKAYAYISPITPNTSLKKGKKRNEKKMRLNWSMFKDGCSWIYEFNICIWTNFAPFSFPLEYRIGVQNHNRSTTALTKYPNSPSELNHQVYFMLRHANVFWITWYWR